MSENPALTIDALHVVVCKYMAIDGGHIQGIFGPYGDGDEAVKARAWLRQLPGMGDSWDWDIWPLTTISILGALPGDLRNDGERGPAKQVAQHAGGDDR